MTRSELLLVSGTVAAALFSFSYQCSQDFNTYIYPADGHWEATTSNRAYAFRLGREMGTSITLGLLSMFATALSFPRARIPRGHATMLMALQFSAIACLSLSLHNEAFTQFDLPFNPAFGDASMLVRTYEVGQLTGAIKTLSAMLFSAGILAELNNIKNLNNGVHLE